MSFTLENVVPWGRSFDEYINMFALTSDDLNKNILGCSDGPAAFNATLTKKGGQVLSFDPLYKHNVDEISQRIDITFTEVIEQVRKNKNEFVWKNITSVDALGKIRMDAMRSFLEDFPKGLTENRYLAGKLPHLPFKDNEFGVALCSHFLFLYSEQLSLDFHLESLRELCRVSEEVRIFPLMELGSTLSRHLQGVITAMKNGGCNIKLKAVPYEFQKGGDQMMVIRKMELFPCVTNNQLI